MHKLPEFSVTQRRNLAQDQLDQRALSLPVAAGHGDSLALGDFKV